MSTSIFFSLYFVLVLVISDCGNPEVPANGKVTLQSGYSTAGSLATQYCNLGSDLEGSTTIVCLDTGEWSDGPVTCTMKSES